MKEEAKSGGIRPNMELHTDNLKLRLHRESDLKDLIRLWSDPEVVRFINGTPLDTHEVWKRILIYRGLWILKGFGFWVVKQKHDDAFVGEVGFADFKRGVPALEGSPEAGWAILPEFQGRGYALEAMGAALEWLKNDRQPERVVCMIGPDNIRSLRLAGGLGFERVCSTDYRGKVEVFARMG